MGCVALWPCNSNAPFAIAATPSFKSRKFSAANSICCCTDNKIQTDAVSDPKPFRKRWFNPDRGRVLEQQLNRSWVGTETLNSSDAKADRFLVMSYNILGDNNASKHRDLYSHIPSHFLKWDRRMGLICQELSVWQPDIVCLQEVDRYDELMSSLRKEGYVGSFKRRTGDAMDGCAVFWKHSTFHFLDGECIEFKAFDLRDNVAQLLVLEMKKPNPRRLLVGNIHVLFNPNRGDIKLGQIRLLLWKAHALSKKWGSIPIVLAGDFNSTPKSAVYEFLASSELNITTHDRRHLSGQTSCQPALPFGMPRQLRKPYTRMSRYKYHWTDEEVKIASGSSECTKLEHPLKLSSSYASNQGNSRTRGACGEPLATTYHANFLGTVDYLWCSDGLIPTKVLDTLYIDVLQKTGGLPSKKLGSDHLALASEFIFVDDSSKEDN